jgi:DNA polymerase
VVPDGQAVAEAQALSGAAGDIEALERAVADFTGCNLRNSARSTAFVDGNRKSRIVIIGAVSTAEDDRDGVPFSGPAGDLLDRMLKAIGLSRQDVLLANIIPWRPPGSRAPSRPEMDICRPFVERLLSLARPEAVLLLGNFPARFFLDANGSIHGLRGRWFDLPVAEGVTVPTLATFHPSDILQAPLNKPLVWRDLLMFRMALAPHEPR